MRTNQSRPDNADGELRIGVGVNRLHSDAFVLRQLEAARTTTRVDYKLGADVNRLRSDVFVLRVLRCLTFELTWRLRNDRQALEKTIYRMALEGPGWHAVGSQVERRVRFHGRLKFEVQQCQ